MTAPALSVVVPTRDRAHALVRLLESLSSQVTSARSAFEVIAVIDGGDDDTASQLRSRAWSFPVRVIEQPGSGPAAARNRGASEAAGDILVFLDDDVEAQAGVVQAHLQLQETTRQAIGLGYLPPVVRENDFFGTILRGWWAGMFDGPRHPGHRFTYRDLLTGHFSVRRADFQKLGGFDATLTCHEDYEFGYRAIRAGFEFRFLPGAACRHHETARLPKTLRRKRDEGRADVQLARQHPELIPSLPLARRLGGGRLRSELRRLAWDHPTRGDFVARRVETALDVYESLRLRYRWRARLEDVLTYWYWRGVAEAAGSRDRLAGLLLAAPVSRPPDLVLDLSHGLQAAEASLDRVRPDSVCLMYGAQLVGVIQPSPGGERLRGAHLRSMLVGHFARQYLRAAAAAGAVPEPVGSAASELSMSDEGDDAAMASPQSNAWPAGE